MSMRVEAALFACLVLTSVACHKRPPTDDLPFGEVDPEDLSRELKRVQKGEVVGEALRMPKIAVGATDVTINGRRVAARSDLDVPPRLHKVEPVFDTLKGLREHWKTIHPALAFAPAAEITLTPDTGYTAAASLVQTAAFSGYAAALTLRAGGDSWSFSVTIPGPPRPDSEEPPPPRTLEVCRAKGTAEHAGGWRARATTPVPRVAPSLDSDDVSSAPSGVIASPWRPVSDGAIPAGICEPECGAIAIGVEDPATFADVAPMLERALKAARPGATVSFRRACGPDSAAMPATSGSAGARAGKPPQMRMGAVSIQGGLPPEVVQRIVRANFGRFRACYEDGLANNAKLQGRVTAKFVIEAEGKASHVTNAGSDIPDNAVIECILKGFSSLSFPTPEKAPVTAVIPLLLAPGD